MLAYSECFIVQPSFANTLLCVHAKNLIAFHFVYYNFVKQHKTLLTTPDMAAGLMKGFISIEDIVKLVPEKSQGKRGHTKRK
jgi:hypothetical protein